MANIDISVMYLVAFALLCFSPCEGRALRVPRSTRHHNHRNQSRLDHQNFAEHMSRVSNFICSTPQWRLIPLTDLNITVTPENSYYPPATVLRRCGCSTGFCSNSLETCQANDTKEVDLVFRVENRVHRRGVAQFLKVSATEHISCSCQVTQNLIK